VRGVDRLEGFVAQLLPFARVRRTEIAAATLSIAWVFLALASYYLIKPLRSAMVQTRIGVDQKPIAMVLTALFLFFFVLVYGRIVQRVGRRALVVGTYLCFLGCLGAFVAVLPLGGKVSAYAFYVFVSTFNMLVVSQFWSVATEVWNKEEGLRLFGFVGVGAVAGAAFGSEIVSEWAKELPLAAMLLLCAAGLGVCLALSLALMRVRPPVRTEGADAPGSALRLVLASPYLRTIGLVAILLNVVNSNDEWILDKVVSHSDLSEADAGAFYGRFFLVQNLLTLAIQVVLTARVHRRFGAGVALLFLPLVALGGAFFFLLIPTLAVIRTAKLAENATDYSIQANTRELLYLPTTSAEKYAGKNTNDVFVVRVGDLVAAGATWIAAHVLIPRLGETAGLRALVIGNVVLVGVWIVLVRRIGRTHGALMAR